MEGNALNFHTRREEEIEEIAPTSVLPREAGEEAGMRSRMVMTCVPWSCPMDKAMRLCSKRPFDRTCKLQHSTMAWRNAKPCHTLEEPGHPPRLCYPSGSISKSVLDWEQVPSICHVGFT